MKLALLVSDAKDASWLYGALSGDYEIVAVVIERPVGKSRIFMRRAKAFGLLSAVGQVLMAALGVPVLRLLDAKRIREIEAARKKADIPERIIHRVMSVNDASVVRLLAQEKPDYVLVYGTRILSRTLLSDTSVPFLNIHAGITPTYRGGHGAYWALVEGKPHLAGVTLHRIDEGIDTGEVLAQSLITVTPRDSFVTYPLLQLDQGIELARNYLHKQTTSKVSGSLERGKLYAHPAIWEYVFNRIVRGVK